MVNKVFLLGNVGTDPKVSGPGPSKSSSFSLATTERYTRNTGEQVENTEWHRVVTFGKLADFVSKYIEKGKLIHVEGKIHSRSYKGDDGVERYVTEIIANEIKICSKRQDSAPSA